MKKKAKQAPHPLKLHLKLRTDVAKADREAVLSTARQAGARSVRALFPNHRDKELATFYTVDADSAPAIKALMKTLKSHPAVEFVDPEFKRKLKAR